MDMNNLDWEKGLFRLWLVVSSCWYVWLLVALVLSGPLSEYSDLILIAFFLLPMAVLIAYKLLVWALQGFKK